MAPLRNLAVRDLETLVHPYTNLATLRETGPLIIERGQGVFVYDSEGKAYIEGMAGPLGPTPGYRNQKLVEVGRTPTPQPPSSHLFSPHNPTPPLPPPATP